MRFFYKILIITGGTDMANKGKNPNDKLSEQSAAFLEMLTDRGLVEDKQINDEKRRKSAKEKKRKMFHNTQLLLQNYRDITWMLECFPANIAEELDKPITEQDILLMKYNAPLFINCQNFCLTANLKISLMTEGFYIPS